jgi:hypothetical protein
MDCSIYINEVSFTQSSDKDFCVEQVKEIIRMVEIFKSTFGLNYKILYHPNLYERGILPDGRMLSVLLKENPSLGQRFKSMIQKAKRWDRAMLQKPGKAYFCMGENCCMTSVAEAFEASTSEPCSVVLANALGSSFPEPAVDVYTEVKGEKKSLDRFKAYSTLVGHLIKVGHLINKYDKSNQGLETALDTMDKLMAMESVRRGMRRFLYELDNR